jgi:transposase
VISSVPGNNSKGEFLPQIHMIFLFSLDHHMPSYFRILAGSIRDVSSDLDKSGERIYNLLKSRVEIEIMFDAFKNVLNADMTYMRDDYQMEGGTFINFIALVF